MKDKTLPSPGKKRTRARDAYSMPSNDLRWLAALLTQPDPTDDYLAHSQTRGDSALPREVEPEVMLLIAVLKDAVDCILDAVSRSKDKPIPMRVRVLRAESVAWIFGPSSRTDYMFDFVSVCDALHLDVSWMRRQVRLAEAMAQYEPVRKARHAIKAGTQEPHGHRERHYHERQVDFAGNVKRG